MDLTEQQKINFWNKVDKQGENGCWLWRGGKYQKGYGKWRVRHEGKQWQAHRLSYLLVRGELPGKGLVLDHICEVRACVNPDHLNVTTIYLNACRSITGRFPLHKTVAERTKGGVYPRRKKWGAARCERGKLIWLGTRDTKEEAAALLERV